jgi:hypothetical protein
MKRHILLSIATALASNLALAQGTSPPSGASSTPGGDSGEQAAFRLLDTNADGRVTTAEAASDSVLTEVFDKADRNADGQLDVAEYRGYVQARLRALEAESRDR